MASSTITLSDVTDSYETPKTTSSDSNAPSPPSESANDSRWSLSRFSMSPMNLFQRRRTLQNCQSYWNDLEPHQKRECIDSGSSRPFGAKTGWLSAGCVFQRWNEELLPMILRIQNEEENEKFIFAGQKTHPMCVVELWMIDDGNVMDSAWPTIVAKCCELKIAKKTLVVLKKIPYFMDLKLGFAFLPWAEEIVLDGRLGHNGGSSVVPIWDSESASPQRRTTSEQGAQLGGSRILIHSGQTFPFTSCNQATLGGVLILNERCFGLTAAHAFFKQSQEAKADAGADQNDEESDYEEDYELFLAASKAVVGRKENHDAPKVDMPNYNIVYLKHELSNSASLPDEIGAFLDNLDFVGYLPDGRNCSCLPAYQGERPDAMKWISRQCDWALICIHDRRFSVRNEFITPDEGVIVPSRISDSPPRGNVFLAANGRHLKVSHCSGIKSGIFLPNSSKMQEVWSLDTACEPGDCGSWVIDPSKEGILHGAIIASSKVGNISYFLPASQIFAEIQAKWGNETSADEMLASVNTIPSTVSSQAEVPVERSSTSTAKLPKPSSSQLDLPLGTKLVKELLAQLLNSRPVPGPWQSTATPRTATNAPRDAFGEQPVSPIQDQPGPAYQGADRLPVDMIGRGMTSLKPEEAHLQDPDSAWDQTPRFATEFGSSRPNCEFRRRSDVTSFFHQGRICDILEHVPRATEEPGSISASQPTNSEVSFRRVLIILTPPGSCLCLPISTYGGQGVSHPSLSKGEMENHAVLHADYLMPFTLPREPLLSKRPIAVSMNSNQVLDKMSRLNFGEIDTVDYHAEVRDVGTVVPVSFSWVLKQVKDLVDKKHPYRV